MNEDGLEDADIEAILQKTDRIALVGASNRPQRPSNEVMGYLVEQGYTVTPVNPGLVSLSIHGQPVVGRLADAAPLDMVDFFRDPNDIAEDVHAAHPPGRAHDLDAAWRGERGNGRNRPQAGLTVVMNRCPKIEAARLGITYRVKIERSAV